MYKDSFLRGRYVYFVNWHAEMDNKIEKREKSFDIFQFSVYCVLVTGEIEQKVYKKTGFSVRH